MPGILLASPRENNEAALCVLHSRCLLACARVMEKAASVSHGNSLALHESRQWGAQAGHTDRTDCMAPAWTRGSSSPALVSSHPATKVALTPWKRWGLGGTLLWTSEVVPQPGV